MGFICKFADQVKKTGKADGLDQAAKDIFAQFYGGAEAPICVRQDFDGGRLDAPKTSDAFASVMENVDPEDVTRSFSAGLGLL